MAAPSWLTGTLACVMIATSAYCLSRLAATWRWRRPAHPGADALQVLMGVAMAGMLLPRWQVIGAGWWAAAFGTAAAWFAGCLIRALARPAAAGRPDHPAQHLLACLAMLYMLLTAAHGAAAGIGASGPGARMAAATGRSPTLALILALALLGFVIRTADRLSSLAPVASRPGGRAGPPGYRVPAGGTGPAGRRGLPLSPRLAACCEIAMGVTMGYMLIMIL